jgi:DivIVA domain-containing protein
MTIRAESPETTTRRVKNMALTPEDVVNKRFNPTKFREGYDQDEVDDFLDEVVVELRRLNQENEELRQRLVQGEQRIQELQRQAPQGADAVAAPAQAPAPAAVAPEPVFAPAPTPAPAPVSADALDTGNTNNLLQLARRLHEEHVREGMEKRDALIAEGHATAARVVSEAEQGARAQLNAVEQERSTLEQQKTQLEEEKAGLERQIDELRNFEREYRQKLRSYIEGQLHDLDATPEVPSASSAGTSSASGATPASSPSGSEETSGESVQVGAPPAAAPAAQPGVPAFPGAQPSGGFGAYGQPSSHQGFANS